jgi:chemotaxis protein CheC
MSYLSDIQIDSLREVFNISMGKAAASLSSTVGDEVELTIPEVLLIKPEEALEHLSLNHSREICAVSQIYKGSGIDMEAKLIFSEENSLELARSFLGRSTNIEEMTHLEQDSILEIGNILINNFMGSIANLLEEEFEGSLPFMNLSLPEEVFSHLDDTSDKTIMAALVNFEIISRNINGLLVLMIDSKLIDRFLTELLNALLGKNGK